MKFLENFIIKKLIHSIRFLDEEEISLENK